MFEAKRPGAVGNGGSPESITQDDAVRLGSMSCGFRGRVVAIADRTGDALPAGEVEQRLIEFGIIEGALVEILHEGLFGRDPIAVRVDCTTIALRRKEALSILVKPE